MRSPELLPVLQATTLSLDTLRTRALHRLAETANTITELMNLVQKLNGVRESDKFGVQYSHDDWYSLIEGPLQRRAQLPSQLLEVK